ncbi:MAG: hypothetical protein P9F19_15970 [Candidatus Contendobacter sp.]|nr:hypothetical protein [Candidatus Contendobacter sp.]MDG4558869.1 hypothetical protein [Candidatus Contendobacter sp.]
MFDSMHNGWAQQDYAHYQREDAREAREAAIDAAIDWRLDDLLTASFRCAKDTIESAINSIADNAKGEQDQLNRYLLQIWQCRDAKPDSTERKLRDYAVSIVAQIMNSAIMEVVTKEVEDAESIAFDAWLDSPEGRAWLEAEEFAEVSKREGYGHA